MMHKPQSELAKELEEAKKYIVIGGVDVHFKSPDMRYEVQDLVIDAGSAGVMVIYRALYDHGVVFARPLHEWLDDIEIRDKKTQRFTLSDS